MRELAPDCFGRLAPGTGFVGGCTIAALFWTAAIVPL